LCQSVDLTNVDTSAVVRSTLMSLGRLRFLHPNVMESLTEWMGKRIEFLEPKDLVAYLVTTATLNHKPIGSEDFYNELKTRLNPESLQNEVWLDVVWSMSVLGMQDNTCLESVLQPEFCNQILDSPSLKGNSNVGRLLKLLNINAVAEFMAPGYSGPLINVSEHPLLIGAARTASSDKAKLSESVLGCFQNIAASPANCSTRIDTQMGFLCDAECIMEKGNNGNESNAKPVQIADMQGLGRPSVDGAKVGKNQQR
jgi:hypothetical protein